MGSGSGSPVVFEISSDEEPPWVGGPTRDNRDDDHDWLTEILTAFDEHNGGGVVGDVKVDVDDDDDDVVVVGEVVAKPKRKITRKGWNGDGEDDDDCIVLDGDPDKRKDVVTEKKDGDTDRHGYGNNGAVDDDDDDELVIVGEKGQVACRDYPHARHLCTKYPFNSSPHENHCDLCHCYVCDSLAPCMHWGTGMLKSDHCHATDKEEIWNCQRKSYKLMKNASHPASGLSVSVPLPHLNQVPQLNYVSQRTGVLRPNLSPNNAPQANPVRLNLNPFLQNQARRQHRVQVCSTATNTGASNIASQIRTQQPGFVASQSRFQPHLAGQQLYGDGASQRNRNYLGHVTSPRVAFKRTGSFRGTSATRNQCTARPITEFNRACPLQYRQNPDKRTASNLNNLTRSVSVHPCTSADLLVRQRRQQNVGNSFVNTGPTQPQLHAQGILQSTDSRNICQPGAQTALPICYDSSHASHFPGAQTVNAMHYESSPVYHQMNPNGGHHESHGIYSQSGDQIQNASVLEYADLSSQWVSLNNHQTVTDSSGLHIQINQQCTLENPQHNQIYQQSCVDSSQHHSPSSGQPPVDHLQNSSQLHSPSNGQPPLDYLQNSSQLHSPSNGQPPACPLQNSSQLHSPSNGQPPADHFQVQGQSNQHPMFDNGPLQAQIEQHSPLENSCPESVGSTYEPQPAEYNSQSTSSLIFDFESLLADNSSVGYSMPSEMIILSPESMPLGLNDFSHDFVSPWET